MAVYSTDPGPIWDAETLAAATGGTWVVPPPAGWFAQAVVYPRVMIGPRCLLVTTDAGDWYQRERDLSGQAKRSPEELIATAVRRGAAGIMTSAPIRSAPLPVLRTDDSRMALLRLAEVARARFRGAVVGVTGTVGKSTTKDMVYEAVKTRLRTMKNFGNWNALEGAAMAVASLPPDFDCAVIELSGGGIRGLNRRMSSLSFSRPTMGIITELGHGEPVFGGIENTARIKSALLSVLPADGFGVFNADMPHTDILLEALDGREHVQVGQAETAPVRLIGWTMAETDARIEAVIDGKPMAFGLPYPGTGMARNALLAIAAARRLGVPPAAAADALSRVSLPAQKLERIAMPLEGGQATLIDDSYNAEHLAMLQAIEILKHLPRTGRRLAVLGTLINIVDMPEDLHAQLAEPLLQAEVELLITIGRGLEGLRAAYPAARLGPHFEERDPLVEYLLGVLRPGDTVLLKGSRSGTQFRPVTARLREIAEERAQVRPERASADRRAALRYPLSALPPPALTLPGDQLRLLFLGDTYFGETYQAKLAQLGGVNVLEERGYADALNPFRPLLRSADLAVANLETTLTSLEQSPFAGERPYLHRGDPERTLATLKAANVRAVTLANNHLLDYGRQGAADTIGAVQASGIRLLGAGATVKEAAQPVVIRLGRRDVVLLCGFNYEASFDAKFGAYADAQNPGTHALIAQHITADIATVRRLAPQAVIVLICHWRRDYKWASDRQRELARAAMAAGCDLLIGHGSHMMQEIEVVGGRLAVHGIGNFVFHSQGRYEDAKVPPISLIAELAIRDRDEPRATVTLYPIVSDNIVTGFRPRFVTPEEFRTIAQLIVKKSPTGARVNAAFRGGSDEHGPFLRTNWPLRRPA